MRIITGAILASIVFGFPATFILVLADEPTPAIHRSLTTVVGAINLLTIGSLSMSLTAPAGFLGGSLLAVVAEKRKPRWGFFRWSIFGCLCGAGLGAVILVAFMMPAVIPAAFEPRGPFEDPMHVFLMRIAALGAITGGSAGAVAGAYCSRVVRSSQQ